MCADFYDIREEEKKGNIPGTYGRWCLRCGEYKIFAILERIGTCSSDADYVPHCPSCNQVLSPCRPAGIPYEYLLRLDDSMSQPPLVGSGPHTHS